MKRTVQDIPVPIAMPPAYPEPLRVVVREIPRPGHEAEIAETSFEDARSIAAARKSRPGGYLRLPLRAVEAIGKCPILLEKIVSGTDLILRVRLFPAHANVRAR